jgi:hypothetical protein
MCCVAQGRLLPWRYQRQRRCPLGRPRASRRMRGHPPEENPARKHRFVACRDWHPRPWMFPLIRWPHQIPDCLRSRLRSPPRHRSTRFRPSLLPRPWTTRHRSHYRLERPRQSPWVRLPSGHRSTRPWFPHCPRHQNRSFSPLRRWSKPPSAEEPQSQIEGRDSCACPSLPLRSGLDAVNRALGHVGKHGSATGRQDSHHGANYTE